MPSKFVQWSDIDVNFTQKADGSYNVVRGDEAIEQSIKIILSTMKGECVRSDLGSGLYRMLFEPLSEDTAEDIEDLVENNLTRFENRIVVRSVRVTPYPDDNLYRMIIDYQIKTNKRKKNLTTFMPAGEDF